MHPLSAIVTGLLVTSGAAGALLGGTDLGLPPIHFGGQDPDAGGNATGNETGNETDGSASDNETVEEESDNSTSSANSTSGNGTAGNETHDHDDCDGHHYEDCYVSVHDSNDVLLDGGGTYTLEVRDEMDFLNIFVHADSYSPGLGDAVDIEVRDPSGAVVAEIHHDGGMGSFWGNAYLEVDLDRDEDSFASGTWVIDIQMTTLYGGYTVSAEASCDDGYYWY